MVTMSAIATCLRPLMGLALALGIAAWLASCDWRALGLSGAGGVDTDDAKTTIVDIQRSTDGRVLLSVLRGQLPRGSSLVVHRAEDHFHPEPVAVENLKPWKAALAPDGAAAILSDVWGVVSRVELATGALRKLLVAPQGATVADLAISPSGQIVAVAIDAEILLCDAHKGAGLLRMAIDGNSVSQIEFSHDGRRLAMVSGDGKVQIWNVGEVRAIHTLNLHSRAISQLRFFDNDRKLATAGLMDDKLSVIDVATGIPLWSAASGHGGITSLAVAPDGSVAATSGFDERIRLWELDKQSPLRSFAPRAGVIQSLEFTKDGSSVISAGADAIRFWSRDLTSAPREVAIE